MTANASQEPAPQPKVKRRLKIEPEQQGQLEQLLIRYHQAAGAASVAKEQADDLKSQIKGWLLSLYPDGEGLPDAFDVTADPHGRYPGYAMTLKSGFRLDIERMKEESPETYVTYARKTAPTWELREANAGGHRGRRHG